MVAMVTNESLDYPVQAAMGSAQLCGDVILREDG